MMLGPDSRLLTALLIAASAALLVAAIRFRLLPVRIFCGALSIMAAMTSGVAAVNYYYGYYTTWGQAWADFHGGTLEAASSPLYLAERLTPNGSPLPAFWVAAGTSDKPDYKPATMFAAALDRGQQVPFVKLNAGDTANAWSAALPAALTWLWQQLAPPDLRVLFPVHAGAPGLFSTLPVPPVKGHDPRSFVPAAQPGRAVPPCGKLPLAQARKA